MKQITLSAEEREVLATLSIEQLEFFSEVSRHKNFPHFLEVINLMINQEKNIFFTKNEINPDKLFALHAFSRGGIAKLVILIHIIGSSSGELSRRTKKGD